jgi:hypothetical protein
MTVQPPGINRALALLSPTTSTVCWVEDGEYKDTGPPHPAHSSFASFVARGGGGGADASVIIGFEM